MVKANNKPYEEREHILSDTEPHFKARVTETELEMSMVCKCARFWPKYNRKKKYNIP